MENPATLPFFHKRMVRDATLCPGVAGQPENHSRWVKGEINILCIFVFDFCVL